MTDSLHPPTIAELQAKSEPKLEAKKEIEVPTKKVEIKKENPRINEVREKMKKIVDDAGGFGQIGLGSEYWSLRNELQSLLNE